MNLSIQAAIFDLDGTLIDSMGLWEKIDHEFLSRRGIVTPNDYVEVVKTLTFNQSARYAIERFSLPDTEEMVIREWMDMALFEYSNNITLKPGALAYLKFLQKHQIKIGLATTNTPLLYEPLLRNNGVYDFFSSFTTLSEVERDKGHPDIYLLAAGKMEVSAQSCLVFEDTLLGVTGAKRAQMTVIGVYDESSASEKAQIATQADGCVCNFEQMLKYHQSGSIDKYI